MRRYATARAPVAIALGTAACSPDLVRVPTDTAAPQSADTAATARHLRSRLLRPSQPVHIDAHDVWPAATKARPGVRQLRPRSRSLRARPDGGPESATGAMGSRLSALCGRRPGDGTGRVVVTGMHTTQLYVLDSATIVSAPVREVILGLGVGAATKITRLARACGAKLASGALTTIVNVAIDMAVVVQDNQAAWRCPLPATPGCRSHARPRCCTKPRHWPTGELPSQRGLHAGGTSGSEESQIGSGTGRSDDGGGGDVACRLRSGCDSGQRRQPAAQRIRTDARHHAALVAAGQPRVRRR